MNAPIPEILYPKFTWVALEEIQRIRFELPALREYVAAVEPLLALEWRIQPVVWTGGGYTIATVAQVEWFSRDEQSCPFAVKHLNVVYRDGFAVGVIKFQESMGWMPSEYVRHAKERIVRIETKDHAAIEQAHSAAVRADEKRRLIGHAKNRLAAARQVLAHYRDRNATDYIPDAEKSLESAKAELDAATAY